MVEQTRFFITTRDKIDENIANETINACDLIICSDTHELIYVNDDLSYFAITCTDEGLNELIAQTEERIEELQQIAENSVVTGVKGSNETTYRKGNVNLGTSDIGLGRVTNHAQVRGLIAGTAENHLVAWGTDGYNVKNTELTYVGNAANGYGIKMDKIVLSSSVPNSTKTFTLTVNDNGELNIVENV